MAVAVSFAREDSRMASAGGASCCYTGNVEVVAPRLPSGKHTKNDGLKSENGVFTQLATLNRT